MVDKWSNTIRASLIFGFVLIFFFLIGLTNTISELIGDFINLDSSSRVGNIPGLIILFILIGLWAGSSSIREKEVKLPRSVLNGGLSGLVLGLIIGIFSLLLGYLDQVGVDLRKYFVELSRPAIQLLLLGNSIVIGAILNFLIFSLSGALGGLLDFLSKKWEIRQKTNAQFSQLREKFKAIEISPTVQKGGKYRFVLYFVYFLILFIIPLLLGNYWNYALGTVGIYVLMGLGLNIVVGLAGLLDLGYVAFFAIGAYTVGLLTAPEPIGIQVGFWGAIIVSVLMATLAGVLLGLPVLRMRGDYLAIVTLGFGEIIRVLIKSDAMTPYLGGPQGIRDIAGPSIFGISLDSEQAFLYMIFLGILLVIFITQRVQNSRIGRAWVAMREDETVAQAMGINTFVYKLLAFATGAGFAGLGGVLFASRNQYTGPEDHTLMVSINVLCLLIVGGMGSIPGVIVGAFVLKGLPEILRELESFRFLAFGALLVVMMIWRPEGLIPASRRRLELHEESEQNLPELSSAEEDV